MNFGLGREGGVLAWGARRQLTSGGCGGARLLDLEEAVLEEVKARAGMEVDVARAGALCGLVRACGGCGGCGGCGACGGDGNGGGGGGLGISARAVGSSSQKPSQCSLTRSTA